MQTSNAKATLLKLFTENKWFSKIRAVLPANAGSGTVESEIENQLEGFPAYVITKEHRMAQLEAQAQRARAEEMAYKLRQRLG